MDLDGADVVEIFGFFDFVLSFFLAVLRASRQEKEFTEVIAYDDI